MADEFTGAPAAPQGQAGQAEDSGQQAHINLDDLPEFRRWKSEMDRKVSQLEKATREAQRQKEIADQVLGAVRAANPQAADQIAERARLAEMEQRFREMEAAERAREAEQATRQEFENFWAGQARRRGVNENDPAFQRALLSGDNDTVLDALMNITAGPGQPAQPRAPLPPMGGGPAPSGQDALRSQMEAEIAAARAAGRTSEIPDIQRKFRRQGLSV